MALPSAASKRPFEDLDRLAVRTLRGLAIDAVERANSGHPGLPLGVAPMAYVLFSRHLRFAPGAPDWPDRDRFVLSAGHGSALLYSLLHVFGYDLPLEELMRFRQWGSITPGHPERGLTPGVEVTTGPLGQGISNATGMALAAAHLAAQFNRDGNDIVNHRTFVICSDGDLMEGISSEAASFAGNLRLPGLIVLYDDNRISIEGPTTLAFTDDTTARYRSYGWQVLEVEDGNDLEAIDGALFEAESLSAGGPVFVRVHTHIGFGSPKQDSASVHGSPLGAAALKETKTTLGIPQEPDFLVPPEVGALRDHYRRQGDDLLKAWQTTFARADSTLRTTFEAGIERRLPADIAAALPSFSSGEMATRAASGQVLQPLSQALPDLIGGSADLAPSNDTNLKAERSVGRGDFGGRNLHFGVREHAMGAILNGMAAHGGLRPYGGTFLVFSDYMRGAIRLSALSHLPVTYVFTHDSIGLGEDGPTHQPIEHLSALELIPNLHVVRPADANETRLGWLHAQRAGTHPTALILSRQKLPVLAAVPDDAVATGVYPLSEREGAKVTLVASGSEVSIALAAQALLKQEGIEARVLSAPCLKAFHALPEAKKEAILRPDLPMVLVVAAEPTAYLPLLGPRRAIVALDHYGASAPAETLYLEFGITPEATMAAALGLLR